MQQYATSDGPLLLTKTTIDLKYAFTNRALSFSLMMVDMNGSGLVSLRLDRHQISQNLLIFLLDKSTLDAQTTVRKVLAHIIFNLTV
jgi:hypothetical protein